MKQDATVSVPRVVYRTVLGILYNPAHPYDPTAGASKEQRTREDVPWVVIIPELSVVAMVTDEDGEPVVGHVNPQYASSFASRFYNRLKLNPDLLADYRTKPDVFEPEVGYMGKLIPIQFQV